MSLFGPFSASALELLLRLPPLYLMDAILLHESVLIFGANANDTYYDKANMIVKVSDVEVDAAINASSGDLEDAYESMSGMHPDYTIVPHLIAMLFDLVAYCAAAFVLTFNLRQLIVFYAYFVAVAAIPASYVGHRYMLDSLDVEIVEDDDGFTLLPFLSKVNRAIALDYLLQSSLGLVFSSLVRGEFDDNNNRDDNLVMKSVLFSMLAPTVLAVFGLPPEAVGVAVKCSFLLPLALLVKVMYSAFGGIFRMLRANVFEKKQIIENFGWHTFLEGEWARLRIPSLLRTFWLTRLALHLAVEALNGNAAALLGGSLEEMAAVAKVLFTRGAETLIAVLGMTSVVSSVCHYIGSFFHLVLTASADEDAEEKSVASVSAVLFFVLALQTGVTSLEPEKRFARLCKNLCLLLTALFHFIHNMASPVLMSLSASHNYNSRKCVRALLICAFLVVAPSLLMWYLWQSFSVGTWLLAVSAFCVEVIVKVAVTVAVYLLFLYDAKFEDGAWEHLDDCVYYVKAAGNSVEFCFAVFLFLNGGWILLFESGGTIRALMMVIHAYCNIWLEARAGWAAFVKRRTAVTKINSLPDATAEQLEHYDDVCAICYQAIDANSSRVKVTRCNHFFHAGCLRQWLFLQDTCPLCHATLYGAHGELIEENRPNNSPGA